MRVYTVAVILTQSLFLLQKMSGKELLETEYESLKHENETLKRANTELQEKNRELQQSLNEASKEIKLLQYVTAATKKRELKQEGVCLNDIAANSGYDELFKEHVYVNLQPLSQTYFQHCLMHLYILCLFTVLVIGWPDAIQL